MSDIKPIQYGGLFQPQVAAPKNVHGSARWMNAGDVKAAGLDGERGVLVGQTSSGAWLRFNRDGHLVVFAPTGAGKGIGFVQPNLAEYRGSMVVLDPKGENAVRSVARRRALGQNVIVLDPFGKTGMPSDLYNPLGALTYASLANLGPMIEGIADALIPTSEHTREPHWPMGAKRFLSFLLWFMTAHLPEEERNLVKLFELAYSGREYLARIAGAMANDNHPDPEIRRNCVAMGNWFGGREAKEYSYFESQAQNNLGWVGDFVWSKQLGGKPSPPLDLKNGQVTVYLVLPFHHLDRYRPWLRLMVGDLMVNLYDAGGALKGEPVLFLLDEAAVGLGNMSILETASAAVRSAGARIALVYQDLNQLKGLYPKTWGSFLSNAGASLFWSVNDMEVAQLIANNCGQKTTPVPGQPMGIAEPLIRPEAVLRLPPDEVVGLFRNFPPARFGRLNVLTDYRFRANLNMAQETTTPERDTSSGPRGFVPLDLGGGKKAQGSDDPERLAMLERMTGFTVRQLQEMEKEFGKLELRGSQLGYLDAGGRWVVVAEPD